MLSKTVKGKKARENITGTYNALKSVEIQLELFIVKFGSISLQAMCVAEKRSGTYKNYYFKVCTIKLQMCSRAMIKMDADTTSKPRLTTVAAQHMYTIESSERSLSVPPLKQDSKVLSDRILCRPGVSISIANTSPETSPYDLLCKLFT